MNETNYNSKKPEKQNNINNERPYQKMIDIFHNKILKRKKENEKILPKKKSVINIAISSSDFQSGDYANIDENQMRKIFTFVTHLLHTYLLLLLYICYLELNI